MTILEVTDLQSVQVPFHSSKFSYTVSNSSLVVPLATSNSEAPSKSSLHLAYQLEPVIQIQIDYSNMVKVHNNY